MSDETTIVTTSGGGDSVSVWQSGGGSPRIPNAVDSIDCEVDAEGTIILRPRNALAAMFLHQFGHSSAIQPVWECALPQAGRRDRMAVSALRIEQRGYRAQLSKPGVEPIFGGMALSPEEYDACRALVDRTREKARKARATPTTAKKTQRTRKSRRAQP